MNENEKEKNGEKETEEQIIRLLFCFSCLGLNIVHILYIKRFGFFPSILKRCERKLKRIKIIQ